MKILYGILHFAAFFYLHVFYKGPAVPLSLILFGLAWGTYELGHKDGHHRGLVEGKNRVLKRLNERIQQETSIRLGEDVVSRIMGNKNKL